MQLVRSVCIDYVVGLCGLEDEFGHAIDHSGVLLDFTNAEFQKKQHPDVKSGCCRGHLQLL
jgi:hypothetical protein